MPDLRNVRHGRIPESGGDQNSLALLGVAESEERRARRDRHVEIAVLLYCGNHDSKRNRLIRCVPYREGNAAAGPQYSMRLVDRDFRTPQMKHSEIRNDRCKLRVAERKLLGISLA